MSYRTEYPTSLLSLIHSFVKNTQLIFQMTKREIMSRYKGSVLGIFWSFFTPVLMLCIYTFVFSEVFKLRWGNEGDSKTQFAILLFVGLIIQTFFAEVLNRSPSLIWSHTNYVKKVIFPLEILPIITMGAALFHCLISIGVLLMALIIMGNWHWTFFLLPFVLLPFAILVLGISWVLVSLGVFVRDVGQSITIITTMLLFLSPVFYPITAVPLKFRPFIMANPLTFIIEQARAVLFWGSMPNWLGLGLYMVVALILAWMGYALFQKTKGDFADVV